MKKLAYSLTLAVTTFALPFLAYAQTDSSEQTGFFGDLFGNVIATINHFIVPLIFALAFIFFLIRVFTLFIRGGADPEKQKEGKKFVMFAVIGFFLMFSIWGIVNLLIDSLGFDNGTMPSIPAFGSATTNTTSNGASNSFGNTTVTGSSGSDYGAAVTPTNGICPNGYTATNDDALCYPDNPIGTTPAAETTNTSNQSSGAGEGQGTVPPGGTCESTPDCAAGICGLSSSRGLVCMANPAADNNTSDDN